MKAKEQWKPSKYIYKKGRLIGSRNKNEVNVGSRLMCDLIAKVYDENVKKFVKGKLLDLGCGKVPLYIAYKNYIADNICVDWENTLHKNVNIDYFCDLTKKLPFNDNEFDTVLLSDVLEHIPNPNNIINEIYRVLTKNGNMLLNVPFLYWIHEEPSDFYRYTEFAIKYLLENTGFEIIKFEVIGGPIEIITDILSKNIKHIPVIGNSLAAFLQWLTLLYTKTKIGRKINRATSHKFPLGYFVVAEK